MYSLEYNIAMEIDVYETASGKRPLDGWLNKLDKTISGKILVRINRLRLGNFGDCKPISEGVSELRLCFGAGYRIYYSKIKNTLVLLLCGGDKGSQKKDIQKAKGYLEDYKNWEKKYGTK